MDARTHGRINIIGNLAIFEVRRFCRTSDVYVEYDTLCGACAIAAYVMTEALQGAGFDAHFVASSEHAFTIVRVQGKWYAVDLTAMQFDATRPAVYVVLLDTNCPIEYRFAVLATRRKDRERLITLALDEMSKWENQSPIADGRRKAALKRIANKCAQYGVSPLV